MYGSTSSTNSNSENPFENFSPTEFISLSENIATNIVYVKSSWQQLEKAIKIIGSPRDNNGARENFHNVQTITNEKIVSTSKDLQRLTVVVKRGDKQQKLQVERLTSDFKKIVEKYSDSQQLIAAKMKQIILINASQFDDDNNPTNISDSSNRTNEQLIQRQIQQNLEFDNEIMIEREQSVRKIEADILNVNDIMKGLNLLINQQGEVIDSIENTIDHTTSNVEAGTSELLKASQHQAKYRRKVLILLIIAVIVGLIITGIIVSQLKS